MEAGHWLFHHSLIQVVAYNDMLKAQRRALHLRVAQALEAHWAGAEADHAEELAHHYIQADARERALIYLMAAGERAAARSANEAAIQYFEQAAQVLSTLSDTTADIRWRLVTGLGDVYRSKGRYVDSTIALKSGLVLTTTGEIAGDLQAGLYRRLGETAQKQGELEVAQRHFDKALAILGQPSDRRAYTETARSLTGLAWTHFIQGRFEQARECCEASLEHARSAGALGELAAAENLLGGIYYQQNDWTSAQHHTRRALVLREQMDYTWGVASTLSNLGVLAVQAGEWNKARTFFERSLELRGGELRASRAHENRAVVVARRGEERRVDGGGGEVALGLLQIARAVGQRAEYGGDHGDDGQCNRPGGRVARVGCCRREPVGGDLLKVDREHRPDDGRHEGGVGPVVHCPGPQLWTTEAQAGSDRRSLLMHGSGPGATIL